ncbi:tyrosinase, partial [Penicillium angulare]|uniref:tyrosinase n=1 Tax=Penicillium angulare TaxID=116970 RepID=UPI002540D9AD
DVLDAQWLAWISEFNQLESLAEFSLKATQNNIAAQHTGCTLEELRIRRNWRAFSVEEKKAYIDSVLCLQSLPSRTPNELAKGARPRYDDFVATHINQTNIIHRSGIFVAWHRYFIHEFELALQDECKYSGDYPRQPEEYMVLINTDWDWGADADSIEISPVFNGSDTSLSGNGEYIPKQKGIRVPVGNYSPVFLPPGTGGGCVTGGPFKTTQSAWDHHTSQYQAMT